MKLNPTNNDILQRVVSHSIKFCKNNNQSLHKYLLIQIKSHFYLQPKTLPPQHDKITLSASLESLRNQYDELNKKYLDKSKKLKDTQLSILKIFAYINSQPNNQNILNFIKEQDISRVPEKYNGDFFKNINTENTSSTEIL
jgi:lysyl-tRNA synthetase class I